MKLLFICTHNRCRSILAEAIARKLCPDLEVYSAGSEPEGEVHPLSMHYLKQFDFAVEGLQSQSWADFDDVEFDAAITVCDRAANESCPLYLGTAAKVHWGLPDPSSQEPAMQEVAFTAVIETLQKRFALLHQYKQENPNAATDSLLKSIAEQIPAPVL